MTKETITYSELARRLDDCKLFNNAPEGQPVYKFVRWYEHSGVVVSLRDDDHVSDWDAGIAGVIYGETTDDIEFAFEEWKDYIEGNIFYIVVKDPDGEVIDSLGYIRGYEQAEREAMALIDYELSKPRTGHKPKPDKRIHK